MEASELQMLMHAVFLFVMKEKFYEGSGAVATREKKKKLAGNVRVLA